MIHFCSGGGQRLKRIPWQYRQDHRSYPSFAPAQRRWMRRWAELVEKTPSRRSPYFDDVRSQPRLRLSPTRDGFLRGWRKWLCRFRFSDRRDETSSPGAAICPDQITSWKPGEMPSSGGDALQVWPKPLIAAAVLRRVLRTTSLLKWLGHDQPDYYAVPARVLAKRQCFPAKRNSRALSRSGSALCKDGVWCCLLHAQP